MKIRKLALAVGSATLGLAMPVQAQVTMPGMQMSGMKMPVAKKKAPTAKKQTGKKLSKKIAAKTAAASKASKEPVPKTPAAGKDEHGMPAMPGMAMPPGQTMETMPGHDIGATQANADTERAGTDLSAGDATPPAVPVDRAADRSFPPDVMAKARHRFDHEQGGQTFAKVMFNLAEYQAHKGRGGYRWDGEAWFGGDINRLWVKSEGEGTFGKGAEAAEVQLLYSRAVGPYFNAQAGVRHDFKPTPARNYATVGFEGLAPYMFDTEGALFLSTKGDVLARLEGWYDQRITQRLILQPRAEANLSAQDIPEDGIGAGLSNLELGLRLRYEIRREFAPYVGISWNRRFGDTARFARSAGQDASSTSLVLGIRTWF